MMRSDVMAVGRVLAVVLVLTGVAAGGEFTVTVVPSDDPALGSRIK